MKKKKDESLIKKLLDSMKQKKQQDDELKKLREENARIDKEIGVILGKIEEKTLSDSKGGINK